MSLLRFPRSLAFPSILILSCAAIAQQPSLIHLDAPDMPEPDRQHLLQTLEAGPPCSPNELISKAAWIAHDMGYFRASAQAASHGPTSAAAGELTIAVTAGPQYHVAKIIFEGNQALTAEQLKADLALSPGDLFRISLIGKTLERIRQSYARAGYINQVTSPGLKTDERTHLIDLDLQIEEGHPFTFGTVSVTGSESHPGAVRTLIESWKQFQGQPFNPDTLDKWLEQNKAQCPACTRSRDLTFTQNIKNSRVDLKLILPQPTGPASQSPQKDSNPHPVEPPSDKRHQGCEDRR